MNNVVSVNSVSKLSHILHSKSQTIVLVGGCFDILHLGHVIFLEKAKRVGDILIVFLESDQKVKKLKGTNRPLYSQKDRAKILAALKAVDFVIKLPFLKTDHEYDELVVKIKPDVIAVTHGNVNSHHQRIAKLIGAKLRPVTKIIGNYSTSRILSSSK